MYRACMFCSGTLGSNESIERFPVGRTLAFDAAKGRLWAVCPKCARWNLAPIEERWEAIEDAERLFRDTRLRAQSENVAITKVRDGTRLIRIGQALPGELAVWRYGESLMQRRRRALVVGGAGLVALGGILIGAAWLTASTLGVSAAAWAADELTSKLSGRTVVKLSTEESGDGQPAEIRRKHIAGAHLLEDGRGELQLKLGGIESIEWIPFREGIYRLGDPRDLVLKGATARRVLSRAMVVVNAAGARREALDDAVQAIAREGSAHEYLRHAGGTGVVLGAGPGDGIDRLALEMALHEESERRAMEGELAELEAAWRLAEEIAAIADALPGLPKPDSAVPREA
jgi:hypothetical protein